MPKQLAVGRSHEGGAAVERPREGHLFTATVSISWRGTAPEAYSQGCFLLLLYSSYIWQGEAGHGETLTTESLE